MLERSDEDGVVRLTMAAPERLNALSDAMLAALTEVFDALAADGSTRVVVLAGSGKAFCAGHDLREMQAARQSPDGGAAYFDDLFGRCAAMMRRIRELPQPVIAEVGGVAAAAGCQLVASCDMAVAADDARFGVNGVNIGLFCSTPMVALSRNVPRKQAFEMLVTGDFVEAARAMQLGLVNRVVPPGRLREETDALAQQVASKLGSAVRIGKRVFHDQLEATQADAYALTRAAMVENMMDADTAEGIAAFIEKRPAAWR
jgi:enoyl-CoA hydratase/carnithine racemase